MTTAAAPTPRIRVLADVIARPTSRTRALAIDTGLVLAGVAVVALLAKVSFFIGPIPITGQTLGVILVGAALGSARGAAAMTTYMFVGLLGLPVFAGPIAGPAYLLAPSFGFILGFIPAAFGEQGRGFVRLNFGCSPEVLRDAVERMGAIAR